MKRLMLASMLLAGTISTASAVEVWQGDLFATAATTECAAVSWSVNEFARAIFRPANVTDNGPNSVLVVLGGRSAQRYSVTGNLAGNGSYSATAIGSSTNIFSWNGAFSQASVKPAAPTATTVTLVVKARLANFFNVANCTLTLQGSLGKRPDL
jgi:hypothetical protein